MNNDRPEVGDFIVATYGYDETHANFWKVVGHTPSGKSIRVQPWTKRFISDPHAPCTYVVPGDAPAKEYVEGFDPWQKSSAEREANMVDAAVVTKRWNGYAKMSYVQWASKWEGQPVYETGFGWGH